MPIWCEEPKNDGSPEDAVRAGTQPALHCFILYSSAVFRMNLDKLMNDEILETQESICLKVLNMYRHVIMKVDMNDITWNQLLIVLVHISKNILNQNGSPGRGPGHSTLAERIQAPLIQTLIVAWIKASLYAAVSMDLWDDLLDLLKDMTHLKDMITEWTKTMDVLSKMLVKQVYKLEIDSLPLEKPSDTKRKRRGKKTEPINRSVSEAPSRSVINSINKTISAPGEGGLADSSSDSVSYVNNVDHSKDSWNEFQRSEAVPSHKIKRAMSETGIPTDESEVRSRTKSGSSLKEAQFTYFQSSGGDQTDCQSDTTSIQQEWNPEITHQEDSGISDHPSAGGGSSRDNHRDNVSVSFSTKPYDTNTVIFEHVSGEQDPNYDEDTTVMSGGRKTGWSMDVAFVLWKRIMGILGNINSIKDPELHERVFTYLHKQWDYLYRVRDNLGISIDNVSTPVLPPLVPPLHIFVPWCLESFQLPSAFQNGKLLSLELLCRIYIQSQDCIQNIIIKGSGPKLKMTNINA